MKLKKQQVTGMDMEKQLTKLSREIRGVSICRAARDLV